MALICVWLMAVGGILLVLPGLLAVLPEAPWTFQDRLWVTGLVLAVGGMLLTLLAQGNDDGAHYRRTDIPTLRRNANILMGAAIALFVVGIGICIYGDMTLGTAIRYFVGVAALTLAASAPDSWADVVEVHGD